MPIDIAAKLSKCRNYSEARPILETLGASRSSHELMQLYFAQPDNSPYKTRFLDTVVQEMEDDDKKLGGPHDKGKIIEGENGENGEKKTQEYELTGTGVAKSSSGPDLTKVGTEKGPVGDAGAQPTEDQMKEMGGMPPGMGMPGMMPGGMPPEVAKQMENAMAGAPPMNPMQQMRYTQEMVKATVGPLYNEVKGIKEAIAKIDNKIQETTMKTVELKIPGGNELVIPKVQESLPGQLSWEMGTQPAPPRVDLAEKRQRIIEKDAILTLKTKNGDLSHMYQ